MLRALLLAAAAGQSLSIIAAAHSVVFRNEMDRKVAETDYTKTISTLTQKIDEVRVCCAHVVLCCRPRKERTKDE